MRKYPNMSSVFWEALTDCCLKLEACWSSAWKMRERDIQKGRELIFPLPAAHETSHHTRRYVSLPDVNCEDPTACVDFKNVHVHHPAVFQLREWLVISFQSFDSQPLLPWGVHIAKNVTIENRWRVHRLYSWLWVLICVCVWLGEINMCDLIFKKRALSVLLNLLFIPQNKSLCILMTLLLKSSTQGHIVLWRPKVMVQNEKNPLLLKMPERWGD